MRASDAIVALDRSNGRGGIKARFTDSGVLLLGDHEIDSESDLYPKIEDAAEEKPIDAEACTGSASGCDAASMGAEDRHLAITTGGLQ